MVELTYFSPTHPSKGELEFKYFIPQCMFEQNIIGMK